jgi:hypothetical protein
MVKLTGVVVVDPGVMAPAGVVAAAVTVAFALPASPTPRPRVETNTAPLPGDDGFVTVTVHWPVVLPVVAWKVIWLGVTTVVVPLTIAVPVGQLVKVTVARGWKPLPLMVSAAAVVVKGTAEGLMFWIPAAVTVKSLAEVTVPPSLF